MKQPLIFALAFAGISGLVFGQAPVAFDVVDVHVSPKSANKNVRGGFLRGGRYELRNATMLDLVRTAYATENDKVLGGPSWLETDRFDVIAKAPVGTPPEKVNEMLQAVLADRFKLVIRNETKPMAAYALLVPKGGKAKIKEADGSGSVGCQPLPQTPAPGTFPPQVMQCHSVTMDSFVRTLRAFGGNYFASPVLNQTNLEGKWDVDLKWHPRQILSLVGSDAITLFDAVDKQLGMKLELQQVPTAVFVVASVNQTPTANAEGVTKSLPTPPLAEFEVANIKPSSLDLPPNLQRGQIRNGRLDLQNLTLKTMLQLAWDFNNQEMIAGAPKFTETARYDIVASAPGTGGGGDGTEAADIDTLRLMLRALLAERFKLKTHMEDRPVSAFNLVQAKPKLTKADPANRTGCREGVPVGVKDPRDTNPLLSRAITCQNMSMAQFADLLQSLASGYVSSPVLDATGLEGNWDFLLSFSANGLQQAAAAAARNTNAGPGGEGAPASDPNGGLTLPEAINRQLGLKLESVKRPVSVLVIDHMEETPTEN